MSYRLHKLLQEEQRSMTHGGSEAVRGLRAADDGEVGLNNNMYLLARSNRGHRRNLLTSLLKMFDDVSVS